MISTWICINVFIDINLDIVKGMIDECLKHSYHTHVLTTF